MLPGGRENVTSDGLSLEHTAALFTTVLMSPVNEVRANTTYLLSLLVTKTVTVTAVSRYWPGEAPRGGQRRDSAPQATVSRPEGHQIISML